MTMARGAAGVEARLSRASALDTLRTVLVVLAPMVARGVIQRRPRVVALSDRMDADRRAVALLGRLRDRYGAGLLRLRLPGRSFVLVLSPDDVRRVLDGTPEPFATANREKRGALSHFQPDGVLISHGAERTERRRFTETVLDTGRPVHGLAGRMVAVVREETGRMLAPVSGTMSHSRETAAATAVLSWDGFAAPWWRLVRRVALGDHAADDHELVEVLTALRRDANWAYMRPKRRGRREELMRRLRAHLDCASEEPGSLAALAATMAAPTTAPESQLAHWLFAFDAAGMATWRALALLASHPAAAGLARDELAGRDLGQPHELPYLRACVLESVRLWPTTLVVLRDSTEPTRWDGGVLPAGTAFAVVSAFCNRGPELLADADRFAPRLWTDGLWTDGAPPAAALVPFSAGPAVCPGRDLVLFLASTLLATLLDGRDFRLLPPARLDPDRPLPATLDPFRLRFGVTLR